DLNGSFFLMAFLIANVVGLLAGSYPAFYLSSFNPLNVLRGTFLPNKGAALLRKGLVSLQFALSVLIIVATIAIYLQIRFIQDRDIGLDRENIIYLAQEGALSSQYEAVRQELLSRPGIANVSASTSNPLNIGTSTGGAKWLGKDPNDDHAFYLMGTSYNFLETMMMELVDGRTFSQDFGADSMSFVVNEEMAKLIGDNTLGTELSFWGNNGPIIGIVKNFDMNSLYSPTAPVIIRLEAQTNSVYIRTEPGQTEEAIASLASVFATFNEGYPFDYHFLDQAFERRFKSEIVLGKLARVFAIIAIFISCLGLFGLVSYSAEQRTKELGVRKVLGASVLNLVGLLTGEVTKLVLLGVVIATPVSYFLISEWLVGFEHHIEIGPGLFFTAGFMAIGIAWLTVSYQAIKSALINPVKAIRYE
ncbi:MAG: FtsX-like permease family protein, partial [Rhodothermales bacterium]